MGYKRGRYVRFHNGMYGLIISCENDMIVILTSQVNAYSPIIRRVMKQFTHSNYNIDGISVTSKDIHDNTSMCIIGCYKHGVIPFTLIDGNLNKKEYAMAKSAVKSLYKQQQTIRSLMAL